jgi:hypothetical protein
MARFRLPYILTLSLSTLALGAVGCSNGSSPTEPAFDDLSAPVAATSSVTDSSVSGEKRHGADDPAGDDRGGNNGGNNGGNSADDNNNNRQRRGRGNGNGNGGNDDPAGDDRGGRRGGRGGNDDPRPAGTSEFEARVLSVSGNTLNLAGGVRVVVNGATQWSARGDLRTLNATAAAVSRNRPVRAEGRGTRQADGSFLAQTLKVEVDD